MGSGDISPGSSFSEQGQKCNCWILFIYINQSATEILDALSLIFDYFSILTKQDIGQSSFKSLFIVCVTSFAPDIFCLDKPSREHRIQFFTWLCNAKLHFFDHHHHKFTSLMVLYCKICFYPLFNFYGFFFYIFKNFYKSF